MRSEAENLYWQYALSGAGGGDPLRRKPPPHMRAAAIMADLAGIRAEPPQRVTGRFLRRLYGAAPVRVREVDMESEYGEYVRPRRSGEPRILVSEALRPYQRASVFLHELGHHRCFQHGCFCLGADDGNVLLEAHAMAFEARACLALRLMRSHRWTLLTILRWLPGEPWRRAIAEHALDLIDMRGHLMADGRSGLSARDGRIAWGAEAGSRRAARPGGGNAPGRT